MAEEKKALDKGEKRDRFLTNLSFAAIAGYIVNEVFERLAKRGTEHFVKRAEKALGFNTEEAEKSIDDEAIFTYTVLDEEFKDYFQRMMDFLAWLREHHCDLAKALVLYVAKLVLKFSREKKETSGGSNKNKGQGQDQHQGGRVDVSYKDIGVGVNLAVKFLQKLLDIPGNDDRVKYLHTWNVNSLISPPKKDPLGPVADKVKELGAKGFKKGQELAVEAGEIIVEHHKANKADLKATSDADLSAAERFFRKQKDEFKAGRP